MATFLQSKNSFSFVSSPIPQKRKGSIMDPVDLVKLIKKNSPQFTLGGRTYFVVERDLKLEESELLDYAKGIANSLTTQDPNNKPKGLVAATINGKPMRWELPINLTWDIDENSFAGRAAELAEAKQLCAAATKDWNDAAKEMGIDHLVQFSENTTQPVFRFAFENFSAGLYAVAFFPNDAKADRWVHIGPTTFETPNDFDPVGVIRHELGHVLGFRHEHIRPEAKPGTQVGEIRESWVVGSIGGENLTDYDSQSVMHYPLSNGRGTMDFKLSDKDKAGLRDLYLMDASKVEEFSI
jgi:hypothetical protein